MDENLEIRLQRAASWIKLTKDLERSNEDGSETLDPTSLPRWAREQELFIFYWIAFNALYGTEGEKEWHKLEDFFKKVQTIAEREEAKGVSTLKEAIDDCLNDCATVIRDKFLDEAYWKNLKHEKDILDECRERYKRTKVAVDEGKYDPFLSAVFDHLRILRNQIMHGSSSHGPNSKGKDSLLPGLKVMRVLVPVLFDLVSRHGDSPGLKWSKVPFPRYGSEGHPRRTNVRVTKKVNQNRN